MNILLQFFFLIFYFHNSINPKPGKNARSLKKRRQIRRKKAYGKKVISANRTIIKQLAVNIDNTLQKELSEQEKIEAIKKDFREKIKEFCSHLPIGFFNPKEQKYFKKIFDHILKNNTIAHDEKQLHEIIRLEIKSEEKSEEKTVYIKIDGKEEILFNNTEINSFEEEIKKTEKTDLLTIIAEKINTELNAKEFKVEGNEIKGDNKIILSTKETEKLMNQQNIKINVNGKDINLNREEIMNSYVNNTLKKLIDNENKVKNYFLEYIIKGIEYFSPYAYGKLNLWSIFYFIDENSFVLTDEKINFKNKLVLKKFIIEEDKYKFKQIIPIIKEYITGLKEGENGDNKELIINTKRKLTEINEINTKNFSIDYKIMLYFYHLFIIEVLLLKENKQKNVKIYDVLDQLFINDKDEIYNKYKNKIITYNIFETKSILDIFESKIFFLKTDYKTESSDLQEENINIFNNDFNLSLLMFYFFQITDFLKNNNNTEIIEESKLESLLMYSINNDRVFNQNQIKEKMILTLKNINQEQEKIRKKIDETQNSDEQEKIKSNYTICLTSLLNSKKSIPLIKTPENFIKILDCFKLNRRLNNSYSLLLYSQNSNIYSKEMPDELFKTNDFLLKIFQNDNEIPFFQEYLQSIDENNTEYKEKFEKSEQKYNELIRKQKTESISIEEKTEIKEFETKKKFFEEFAKQNVTKDTTNINELNIKLFLDNLITGYSTSDYFDIDRLYHLIIQAVNSKNIIEDLQKKFNNDNKQQKIDYLKNIIQYTSDINKLYIHFLFEKLNQQFINHCNIEKITESGLNNAIKWSKMTLLAGSGSTLFWATGGFSLIVTAGEKGLGIIADNPMGSAIVGGALLGAYGIKKYGNSIWHSTKNLFSNLFSSNNNSQEKPLFV